MARRICERAVAFCRQFSTSSCRTRFSRSRAIFFNSARSSALSCGAGGAERLVRGRRRLPAELAEQRDGGLLDELSDEGEALPQLQQKLLHVGDQRGLEFLLMKAIGEREEVEDVRVLERLVRQVRLRLRQPRVEIGDGLAAALLQTGFDLHHQHVARPAVFDGFGCVPAARFRVVQLVQERQVVIPGQLCKGPLHNRGFGPCFGEGPHVLEVARRKSLHVREGAAQILRQPLDHPRAPALAPGCRGRSASTAARVRGSPPAPPAAGRADAGLQLGQPGGVVGGGRGERICGEGGGLMASFYSAYASGIVTSGWRRFRTCW